MRTAQGQRFPAEGVRVWSGAGPAPAGHQMSLLSPGLVRLWRRPHSLKRPGFSLVTGVPAGQSVVEVDAEPGLSARTETNREKMFKKI